MFKLLFVFLVIQLSTSNYTNIDNWIDMINDYDYELIIDDFAWCEPINIIHNNKTLTRIIDGQIKNKEIKICKSRTEKKILHTIAHECIHILQFNYGLFFNETVLNNLKNKIQDLDLIKNHYADNVLNMEIEAHFLDNYPSLVYNIMHKSLITKSIPKYLIKNIQIMINDADIIFLNDNIFRNIIFSCVKYL